MSGIILPPPTMFGDEGRKGRKQQRRSDISRKDATVGLLLLISIVLSIDWVMANHPIHEKLQVISKKALTLQG